MIIYRFKLYFTCGYATAYSLDSVYQYHTNHGVLFIVNVGKRRFSEDASSVRYLGHTKEVFDELKTEHEAREQEIQDEWVRENSP